MMVIRNLIFYDVYLMFALITSYWRDSSGKINITAGAPCIREWVVLCIGSNLGLKFGRERPIRVLLPHLAEPKIYK